MVRKIIGEPITRESLTRLVRVPNGYIFTPPGYGSMPGYISPGPNNNMTMTVNLFPNDDGEWFEEAVKKNGGTCRQEGFVKITTRLLDFLGKLEAAIPPPRVEDSVARSHHSITSTYYVSDETGWEPRLGLHVSTINGFITFFLDENEFDQSDEKIIDKIKKDLVTKGDL